MDIETYSDDVLSRMEANGVDLNKVNVRDVSMLIVNCHGKGVPADRAARDIAKKLKGEAND